MKRWRSQERKAPRPAILIAPSLVAIALWLVVATWSPGWLWAAVMVAALIHTTYLTMLIAGLWLSHRDGR